VGPRCIELFAGAGGAALGLERVGLHHAALCEWDASACATLRAAGLGPVVEGDVRDLGAIAEVAGPDPVDVLWSSFPCQAFSTAGKRLGAADERNGWPWTVDAIDRFKPTWLLGENVRGLLLHRAGCTYRGGQEGLFSSADPTTCPGCYFERVILPDLRARFAHVGWWLLDAADYGVPQHRRRVILWAGPAPLTEPTPTHGPGRAVPWVSMAEALGLGGAGLIVQSGVCDSGCTTRGGEVSTCEPAPTVPVSSHLYLGQQTAGILYIQSGPKGEIEPCADQPAPTVVTGWGNVSVYNTFGAVCVAAPEGRRRLTVEECALLQDFPADHPWQGGVGARYRQAGNAVPPRLAEVVGRALMAAIGED